MSLVFVTMLIFFLVFDVLILVDDVMAGPILGLKFLDPCHKVSGCRTDGLRSQSLSCEMSFQIIKLESISSVWTRSL